MKTETKVQIGMALFGMVTTNVETMAQGALFGYGMAWLGCKAYRWFKKPHQAKEIGADMLVGVLSLVMPTTMQYAKNLTAIKEGTKKPYKVNHYNPNHTYYYKELADIFGLTQVEMITILRKYIIKGKYPNVELRKGEWGEYKLNNNGNRVYIEYTAECIEYLRVMMA